jgi:hypothetical protein
LVHIYGDEGIGKSTVAKFSAQYCIERRKFIDGVYYIDVGCWSSAVCIFAKIRGKVIDEKSSLN